MSKTLEDGIEAMHAGALEEALEIFKACKTMRAARERVRLLYRMGRIREALDFSELALEFDYGNDEPDLYEKKLLKAAALHVHGRFQHMCQRYDEIIVNAVDPEKLLVATIELVRAVGPRRRNDALNVCRFKCMNANAFREYSWQHLESVIIFAKEALENRNLLPSAHEKLQYVCEMYPGRDDLALFRLKLMAARIEYEEDRGTERAGPAGEAAHRKMAELLEVAKVVFGERHLWTAKLMQKVCDFLMHIEAYEEAEPLAREVVAIREELMAPDARQHLAACIRRDRIVLQLHENEVETANRLLRNFGQIHRLAHMHPSGLLLECGSIASRHTGSFIDEVRMLAAALQEARYGYDMCRLGIDMLQLQQESIRKDIQIGQLVPPEGELLCSMNAFDAMDDIMRCEMFEAMVDAMRATDLGILVENHMFRYEEKLATCLDVSLQYTMDGATTLVNTGKLESSIWVLEQFMLDRELDVETLQCAMRRSNVQAMMGLDCPVPTEFLEIMGESVGILKSEYVSCWSQRPLEIFEETGSIEDTVGEANLCSAKARSLPLVPFAIDRLARAYMLCGRFSAAYNLLNFYVRYANRWKWKQRVLIAARRAYAALHMDPPSKHHVLEVVNMLEHPQHQTHGVHREAVLAMLHAALDTELFSEGEVARLEQALQMHQGNN